MACDHSASHSGGARYLRGAGQLQLVLLCDNCGAERAQLQRIDYRPNPRRLVVHLAELTARELGLGEAQIDRVRFAALVCGVGREEISPAILAKRGPLTQEEWTEVRRQPDWRPRCSAMSAWKTSASGSSATASDPTAAVTRAAWSASRFRSRLVSSRSPMPYRDHQRSSVQARTRSPRGMRRARALRGHPVRRRCRRSVSERGAPAQPAAGKRGRVSRSPPARAPRGVQLGDDVHWQIA